MSEWILVPITLGMLALVIGLFVYVIRLAVADWKENRDLEARVAEQHRENKAFSLTLQRAIWEAQEWEVDVSAVRAAKDAFDFSWKSRRALRVYQMRIGTPLGLAIIPLFVEVFLPLHVAASWVTLALAGVALMLLAWALVRWLKYHRFKEAVAGVQAELDKRASL